MSSGPCVWVQRQTSVKSEMITYILSLDSRFMTTYSVKRTKLVLISIFDSSTVHSKTPY